VDGRVKKGTRIRLWQAESEFEVQEVGAYTPLPTKLDELHAGEVGFIIASIKDIHQAKVGDTITEATRRCDAPFLRDGEKEIEMVIVESVHRAIQSIG